MHTLFSFFAAAEPPTLVLMLIGSGCLLIYAGVRRVPRQRRWVARLSRKTVKYPEREGERRAA